MLAGKVEDSRDAAAVVCRARLACGLKEDRLVVAFDEVGSQLGGVHCRVLGSLRELPAPP